MSVLLGHYHSRETIKLYYTESIIFLFSTCIILLIQNLIELFCRFFKFQIYITVKLNDLLNIFTAIPGVDPEGDEGTHIQLA